LRPLGAEEVPSPVAGSICCLIASTSAPSNVDVHAVEIETLLDTTRLPDGLTAPAQRTNDIVDIRRLTVAQLLIRNLPDEVKTALRRRAHDNGRSMEAEARTILVDFVLPHAEDPVLIWLSSADEIRARRLATDLPTPARSEPRAVSFE